MGEHLKRDQHIPLLSCGPPIPTPQVNNKFHFAQFGIFLTIIQRIKFKIFVFVQGRAAGAVRKGLNKIEDMVIQLNQ